MNHQQEPFAIPLLMILLPLAIGIFYGVLWKRLSFKNKFYAIVSELFLIISLCPFNFSALHCYPMSVHMLRHILILLVFPPLFWAVIPASLAEEFISNNTFKKIARFTSQPIIAYCIGMGVMWIVNIPMLISEGSHHIHSSEKYGIISLPNNREADILLQLLAGVIYSLPAFAPIESLKLMPLQRIVYLFLSCIGCTILGIFISLNPVHMYTLTTTSYSLAATVDMQISGLIMWVPGCLIYISKAIVILSRFFKDKELAESY